MRPNRTTTTPSPTPSPSSRPMSWVPITLLEACRKYDVRFHHVRPTRSTGDLALDEPRRFSPMIPTSPARPTRHPRPARTCSCVRGPAPTACAPRSPTAPTTTGPYQHIEKFIPAPDHQHPLWHPPQALWRRPERPRLDPPEDHSRAVWDILTKGTRRDYLIGANGERTTSTCFVPFSSAWVSRPTPSTGFATAPAMTPLCHRSHQARGRARLEADPYQLSPMVSMQTIDLGTPSMRDWWRDAKDANEAKYASGPIGNRRCLGITGGKAERTKGETIDRTQNRQLRA